VLGSYPGFCEVHSQNFPSTHSGEQASEGPQQQALVADLRCFQHVS
jgi:hypothetical protein